MTQPQPSRRDPPTAEEGLRRRASYRETRQTPRLLTLNCGDVEVRNTAASELRLSVIVPIAPGECEWPHLVAQLVEQLPPSAEILIAASEPPPTDFERMRGPLRWLIVRPGRAAQMNDAALAATGQVLWFLHADSRLPADAVAEIRRQISLGREECLYFGLRFTDGPIALRLNELGVRLRCALLGLPFGDQGFCLRRETFFRLGAYDEAAAYGEDHLLVWSAKRNGVPLRRLAATIATSGRKYASHGWAKTTLQHLWLTARQAVAEALRRPR